MLSKELVLFFFPPQKSEDNRNNALVVGHETNRMKSFLVC